jgi:hypothetical protein
VTAPGAQRVEDLLEAVCGDFIGATTFVNKRYVTAVVLDEALTEGLFQQQKRQVVDDSEQVIAEQSVTEEGT